MSNPLDGNGMAAPELKDGQIYRWHWKEGEQIGALEPAEREQARPRLVECIEVGA